MKSKLLQTKVGNIDSTQTGGFLHKKKEQLGKWSYIMLHT